MTEHFAPEPSALTMFGLYAWIFFLYVVPFLLGLGIVFYAMWKVLTSKGISWMLKCLVAGVFLLFFGYWGFAIYVNS
jgi:hypothetical protein